MSPTDSPPRAKTDTTVDADYRTTSERLNALRQRLVKEHHFVRALAVALSISVLRAFAPSLGAPQPPAAPDVAAGTDVDGGPLSSPANPDTLQAMGAGTPTKTPTGAASAGGASERKNLAEKASDTKAKKDYPLARLHHYFERNAGWGTIVTATILAVAIVIGPGDKLDVQWALFPVGIHTLFIIVLFTRPLKTTSDIDTIFRFAWAFVAAASIFGLLYLIVGLDNHSKGRHAWGIGRIAHYGSGGANTDERRVAQETSPPDARMLPNLNDIPPGALGSAGAPQGKGPVASSVRKDETLTSPMVTAQAQKRSNYLLAVVPGCDYNSVPYRNPRPTNALAPSSATKGASAADVSFDAPRAAQSGMPEGIYCGELAPQWVIVIGGNILECDFDNTCPKVQPHPDVAKLDAEYTRSSEALQAATKHKADVARALDAQGRLLAADMTAEPTNRNLHQDLGEATLEVDAATGNARVAKAALDAAKKFDGYKLNIRGHPIVGGVVVPVFFVAIALMGALINMGRKLPEFQERVDPLYKDEFDAKLSSNGDVQPPISWPYARDMVVFQIIQVLSTPGIAVLAYSWARPSDLATTVILAFAAGFTSEVFLLAVRGVVDRVIGLGPRPPRVRAMLATDLKPDVKNDTPPRGSASASIISPSGFKIGDLVTLVQPVGPCLPGAEGRVLSIEPGDELIVQTTRDHTGTPLSYRLQSQSASSFKLAGKAATAPVPSGAGPVG